MQLPAEGSEATSLLDPVLCTLMEFEIRTSQGFFVAARDRVQDIAVDENCRIAGRCLHFRVVDLPIIAVGGTVSTLTAQPKDVNGNRAEENRRGDGSRSLGMLMNGKCGDKASWQLFRHKAR